MYVLCQFGMDQFCKKTFIFAKELLDYHVFHFKETCPSILLNEVVIILYVPSP